MKLITAAALAALAITSSSACGAVEEPAIDSGPAIDGAAQDAANTIDAPPTRIDAGRPDAAAPDAAPPDATPPPPTTTLATWLLNGTISSTNPVPVSTTVANVSAGVLSQTGLTGTNFANAFVTDNWPSSALDPGKYFSFSVTAGGVASIRYDTVRFSLYNNHTGSTAWELRASHDSFATALDSGTSSSIVGSGTPITADVSAIGTVTGTVTFRFYTYNNSGSTSPLQRGFRGSAAGGIDLTVWGALP
jgi:hypothetical protein